MTSPSFVPNSRSLRRISLQQIDAVVTARLGATRGLGKSQPACFNRQIAMYLANHLGRWSTTAIGRFYSGRDHSTVVHSIKRIESLRELDPVIDTLLTELEECIHVQAQPPTTGPTAAQAPTSRFDRDDLVERIANQICELLKQELRIVFESRDFKCYLAEMKTGRVPDCLQNLDSVRAKGR